MSFAFGLSRRSLHCGSVSRSSAGCQSTVTVHHGSWNKRGLAQFAARCARVAAQSRCVSTSKPQVSTCVDTNSQPSREFSIPPQQQQESDERKDGQSDQVSVSASGSLARESAHYASSFNASQLQFAARPAHGKTGKLIPLVLTGHALESALLNLPAWRHNLCLNSRQMCDLELLLSGAFSPLTGFMSKEDYESVLTNERMADGTLFPLPITLDCNEHTAQSLIAETKDERRLVLKDEENNLLAIMQVESIWQADKRKEARHVFGPDPTHPSTVELLSTSHGSWRLGGRVCGLQLPPHFDHADIRHTPMSMRTQMSKDGWTGKETPVIAFQTRNPLHRAHFELTLQAARDVSPQAKLLLHPVVGLTKSGDIDAHTRVKCYRAMMHRYPPGFARLSVLHLAMRMAGPREALMHAIIRQNFGATHFILGRDHAGPGSNAKGEPFYKPYEARDHALAHQHELSIKLLPFDAMLYLPQRNIYAIAHSIPAGTQTESLSGTELRRRLQQQLPIAEWISFPEVVSILRESSPPPHQQGFCVFFTGLSGSGKCIHPSTPVLIRSREPQNAVDADTITWQQVPASQVRQTDLLCDEHGQPVAIQHLNRGESHTMMRVVTDAISSKGEANFTFDVTPEHELVAEWRLDHMLSCRTVGRTCDLSYYTFDRKSAQFQKVTLSARIGKQFSDTQGIACFDSEAACHAHLLTQLAAVGRWNDVSQSGGILVRGSKVKIQAQHWANCLSQLSEKDRANCVRAVSVQVDTKRESQDDNSRLAQYVSVTPIQSCVPQPWIGFTVDTDSHIFALGNGLLTGNSTLAFALQERLRACSSRPVTLLDGDRVRNLLSSDLSFSKPHREQNIRRIGYIASLCVRHAGRVICSPIAPYASSRLEARRMCIAETNNPQAFIEVYLSTPLASCQRRDRKGLYLRASQGLIKHMTGVDDPYERPLTPELTIDTCEPEIEDCVDLIMALLLERGFVRQQDLPHNATS